MKLATICLVLLLTHFTNCDQSNGQVWAQKLFAESRHDFGDVFVGETAEHRFQITNNRDFPISIDPSVSSGPFLVSSTADLIRPGESAELVCKITAPQGSGGHYSAHATVRFSGREIGEAQLGLTATPIANYTFDKTEVQFPDTKLGNETSVNLKLVVPKAINHQLKDVRSKFTNVRVKIVSVNDSEAALEYQLKIEITQNGPRRRNQQ